MLKCHAVRGEIKDTAGWGGMPNIITDEPSGHKKNRETQTNDKRF